VTDNKRRVIVEISLDTENKLENSFDNNIVIGVDVSDDSNKKTVDKFTKSCIPRSLSWYFSSNQHFVMKLIKNLAAKEYTITLKKCLQGYL
ncbi:31316_t:CDS:1, partial [Racocetra persica]